MAMRHCSIDATLLLPREIDALLARSASRTSRAIKLAQKFYAMIMLRINDRPARRLAIAFLQHRAFSGN